MCEDKYKQIQELLRDVQILTASNRELREKVARLQRELDETREATETEGWTK